MMIKFRFLLVVGLILAGVACREELAAKKGLEMAGSEDRALADWKPYPRLGYEVVRVLPHDPAAFTQGLLLSGGDWIESTGGYGTTSLRRVEKETGRVLKKVTLQPKFFGEGVAELNGKLFQLTWQSQQGFIYDAETLEWQGSFRYRGEGWGLTTDGESLIMSDGSSRLRYLDPETLRMTRDIAVRRGGRLVEDLNELEFIEGEIFANVWHREEILRIDPEDGKVLGVIDLTGINANEPQRDPEHVLNGIAYDPATQELFVTGKCWSKIYQIRLVPVR